MHRTTIILSKAVTAASITTVLDECSGPYQKRSLMLEIPYVCGTCLSVEDLLLVSVLRASA